MARSLSVTEPHPSVPRHGGHCYIGGGRGGAGNFKCYTIKDLTAGPTATGLASRINLPKTFKHSHIVSTGRGGVGNMFSRAYTEERVFMFDEEMMDTRELQAPVYHIGRGGAANWAVDENREIPTRRTRTDSTTSSSAGSLTSESSINSNNNGPPSGEAPAVKFPHQFTWNWLSRDQS